MQADFQSGGESSNNGREIASHVRKMMLRLEQIRSYRQQAELILQTNCEEDEEEACQPHVLAKLQQLLFELTSQEKTYEDMLEGYFNIHPVRRNNDNDIVARNNNNINNHREDVEGTSVIDDDDTSIDIDASQDEDEFVTPANLSRLSNPSFIERPRIEEKLPTPSPSPFMDISPEMQSSMAELEKLRQQRDALRDILNCQEVQRSKQIKEIVSRSLEAERRQHNSRGSSSSTAQSSSRRSARHSATKRNSDNDRPINSPTGVWNLRRHLEEEERQTKLNGSGGSGGGVVVNNDRRQSWGAGGGDSEDDTDTLNELKRGRDELSNRLFVLEDKKDQIDEFIEQAELLHSSANAINDYSGSSSRVGQPEPAEIADDEEEESNSPDDIMTLVEAENKIERLAQIRGRLEDIRGLMLNYEENIREPPPAPLSISSENSDDGRLSREVFEGHETVNKLNRLVAFLRSDLPTSMLPDDLKSVFNDVMQAKNDKTFNGTNAHDDDDDDDENYVSVEEVEEEEEENSDIYFLGEHQHPPFSRTRVPAPQLPPRIDRASSGGGSVPHLFPQGLESKARKTVSTQQIQLAPPPPPPPPAAAAAVVVSNHQITLPLSAPPQPLPPPPPPPPLVPRGWPAYSAYPPYPIYPMQPSLHHPPPPLYPPYPPYVVGSSDMLMNNVINEQMNQLNFDLIQMQNQMQQMFYQMQILSQPANQPPPQPPTTTTTPAEQTEKKN